MDIVEKKLAYSVWWFIYHPYMIFFLVAMLITFPLWHSGYLFLLDWNIASGSIMLWQQSFAQIFIVLLGLIIEYALFQKMLCFSILFFLGIGGFLFVQEIINEKRSLVKMWVSYIGGFFMMINPFVYARLIDGQWFVMFGMIFVLYVFIHLLRWYKLHRRKDVIYAIIYSVFAVMISHHAVFFIFIIVGSFFALLYWKKRNIKNITWIVFFFSAILIANINIILGYALNLSPNSVSMHQFNQEHLQTFSAIDNGNASIYINVLSLHGYWGENQGRFLSTQKYVAVWKPLFLIFFAFVLVGIYFGRKKFEIIFLVFTGIISYILAIGIKGIFGPLVQFLYAYIPFYMGLREPHKWLNIFVICFCGIMIYGLYYILILVRQTWAVHVIGVAFIVMIITYTPTIFFGFQGQMQVRDFPQEWYRAKEKINCENNDKSAKVLFLPWHQYLKIDFLHDKKVANPAQSFFGSCILSGDYLELNNLKIQNYSNQTQIVKKYFDLDDQNINKCTDFFADMKSFSIKFIILSKSEDYNKYLKLDNSLCVQKIQDDKYINIYKILN